jgi:hypothetical protein
MTVRSVPRGLQRDAWWMAADAQTGVGSGGTKAVPKPLWLLQTLILVMSSILWLALNVDGLPARVTLGVRPEHLSLADGPADLTVTPTMIENTGAECHITFDLAGISLTAKVPGRMDEDTLDPIGLNVATTALSLFDIDTGERINRP